MKKLFLLLLVLPNLIIAQIDIDETEKVTPNSIPFDGSFMKLPMSTIDDGVMLGLIGEKVTLIDVSYFDVKLEDGISSASFSDSDKFKNKTFDIIAAQKEYGSVLLTIKNDSGTFKWKPSSISKYVFNKSIDVIKKKLLGKTYSPLHNQTQLKTLDGSKVTIDGKSFYTITKVSYSKFSIIEYGIKVVLNDSIPLKYKSENVYDQPRIFDGSKMIPHECWIYLDDDSYSKATFIEKDSFEEFKLKNRDWLSKIRDRVVAVGMTEKQCRWAWVMPESSYGSLAGYDEVYEWGGKTLYFKNDKLALIK